MKAVAGEVDGADGALTISDLALAGVKNIAEKAEVAVDLHSAVYMFHLTQALIKHVSLKDAYNVHVGKQSPHQILYQNRDYFKNSNVSFSVPLCKGFLSRRWYSFEGREMHGGENNSLLEQLLKGYFKDSKFSFIRSNLQSIEAEVSDLKIKGGKLETFPCIKV